jgi:hypothetical protein
MTIYQISPRVSEEPMHGQGRIQNYPILKAALLTDEQCTIVTAIFADPSCFGTKFMRCFIPRMALSWEDSGSVEERICCLHCQIIQSYPDQKSCFPTPEICERLRAIYSAAFPEAPTDRL